MSATLGNRPSDEEFRALSGEARRLDREIESLRGQRRAFAKRMKSAGINLAAFKLATSITKLDEGEAASELKDTLDYMRLFRMPMTQADLGFTDGEPTVKVVREDDLWDAEEAGFRAGRHGEKIEACPYPTGSELFVTWRAWWGKGQAQIAKELGPNARVATPSRERPPRQGRIPGTERRARVSDNLSDMPPPRKRGRPPRRPVEQGNGGAVIY